MSCPNCRRPKGQPHEYWCKYVEKEEVVETAGHVQSYKCPHCGRYRGQHHESWCQYR